MGIVGFRNPTYNLDNIHPFIDQRLLIIVSQEDMKS